MCDETFQNLRTVWSNIVSVVLTSVFTKHINCLEDSSGKHVHEKYIPHEPLFYKVKMWFTGVLSFLISAQKYRLWVFFRTDSARRF